MAIYESIKTVSVKVNVASGVAAALANRFAIWDTNADRVITHVPAAAGAAANGILAETVSVASDGEKESSLVIPNGGIAKVELGEAVATIGAPLRIGGNAGEVDGAAYLANATSDVIVGWARETGAIGEIISFQFVPYGGLAA